MGLFSIAKNILVIITCINLIGVWLFNIKFSFRLGIMVLVVMGLSLWVILQQIGIAPSHKG